MRKQILRILIPGVAGSLLMTGCVYSHRGAVVREPATVTYPSGEVVVSEPPPEPRREYYGTSPDEQHVWVSGYWARANHRWLWVPGHWELRPRPAAVWVPGHWDKNVGAGWTWTAGHWE